jgi:hypothetical protein
MTPPLQQTFVHCPLLKGTTPRNPTPVFAPSNSVVPPHLFPKKNSATDPCLRHQIGLCLYLQSSMYARAHLRGQ